MPSNAARKLEMVWLGNRLALRDNLVERRRQQRFRKSQEAGIVSRRMISQTSTNRREQRPILHSDESPAPSRVFTTRIAGHEESHIGKEISVGRLDKNRSVSKIAAHLGFGGGCIAKILQPTQRAAHSARRIYDEVRAKRLIAFPNKQTGDAARFDQQVPDHRSISSLYARQGFHAPTKTILEQSPRLDMSLGTASRVFNRLWLKSQLIERLAFRRKKIELVCTRHEAAMRLQIAIEAREQAVHDLETARQNRVKVLSLRRTVPDSRSNGHVVAIEHHDLVKMIRQYPSRQETANPRPDHRGCSVGHRVPQSDARFHNAAPPTLIYQAPSPARESSARVAWYGIAKTRRQDFSIRRARPPQQALSNPTPAIAGSNTEPLATSCCARGNLR